MRINRWFMIMSFLLLVLISGAIAAQESAKKPVIDPEADVVLRQMSDHLKTVNASIFHLTDTIDELQADGRKFQFAHTRQLTVVRPDKLKIDVTGDLTNRTVWKDGKTITVFDKDKGVYAQLPDPGTIDQAVDMLQEKYGMGLPGADLLTDDAYKSMTERCSAVDYVGLGYVGDEKCHHLAFTGDDIDWQLWVTVGKDPAPRKMVITYKKISGEPQYTQQLLKKEDPSKIKDAVFTAEIPKGTEKIDFQPRRP